MMYTSDLIEKASHDYGVWNGGSGWIAVPSVRPCVLPALPWHATCTPVASRALIPLQSMLCTTAVFG